jgi:hypothetical protein
MAFKMKGAPYGSPAKYKKSPVKDAGTEYFADMKDEPEKYKRFAKGHDDAYGKGHPDRYHDMGQNPTEEEKKAFIERDKEMQESDKGAAKGAAKGAMEAASERITQNQLGKVRKALSPNKQKEGDDTWGPEKTKDKKGWEELEGDKKQGPEDKKADTEKAKPGKLRIERTKGDETWGPEKKDSDWKKM